MKLSILSFALPFLGVDVLVNAFPSAENIARFNSEQSQKGCPYSQLQAELKHKRSKRLLFDTMKKPIEITGDHAFVPPNFEAGDQRGPCPGLNALANHGYIPHNGVTTTAQVIFAINNVFGMGLDLATILGVMGTVWVGNPISLAPGFSIGGPTNRSENILHDLLGLIGTPQGLIGSHNLIESDSSNTRDDLYSTGNAHTLRMDKFMGFYNMSREHPVGDYNMDVMARRAADRFQESKFENPYFYYGPFTGLISRNAGYIFPGRLFRNHSRENPEGTLTKNIIKNFYGIYGEEDCFEYKEGWERIPENWYRTPVDYGLIQFNLDIIDWVLKHPELASIGGNLGKIDTFAGLDLGNLTTGIANIGHILEDNNLICFLLQFVKTFAPNALSGAVATVEAPLKLITETLKVPLLDLGCPAMADLKKGGKPIWDVLLDTYPGAKKSGTPL
ncbi:hypothetical protein AJ78_01368 [Emergomyces pasteurianus Ep9510]|uniref:Heme haloperoxidase family profile domain-containing protein n=1 Tax=Emergomyces pasteurianus Ep9510 TaxID=1447872 RepID=A0A1J9QTJ4_9EURO|nr:hypothetical protein AJ78_01368 [Emergomyces pasteurianus Ep9510]